MLIYLASDRKKFTRFQYQVQRYYNLIYFHEFIFIFSGGDYGFDVIEGKSAGEGDPEADKVETTNRKVDAIEGKSAEECDPRAHSEFDLFLTDRVISRNF